MNTGKQISLILVLALFFAAGTLAGIVLERKVLFPAYNQTVSPEPEPAAPAPGAPPPPQGHRKFFIEKLTVDLDLNEEQIETVQAILEEHEEAFVSLRTEIRENFAELDYTLFTKISDALDDKQKQLFLSEWSSPFSVQPPPPGQHHGGFSRR